MSAPYRWTTKASFTGPRRPRNDPCGEAPARVPAFVDAARHSRSPVPDAGEEHLIDAALPFEVVAAYSNSQRRTGIRMRRFTKTISAAGPVAR